MSKQLDELLELDGSSILLKVGGDKAYPSTFYIDDRNIPLKGLWMNKMSPLDLEPTPLREFHFIKDNGKYALYKEIRRRDK